jgi:hypothetical protein
MSTIKPDLQAAIDARLSDAVAAANYRITLNNQKQNARLKLQKDLTYSVNGGTFTITQELISFAGTLQLMGKEEVILLDINRNPIEIPNIGEFLETITGMYYERMNEFFTEFKGLNKLRSPKALVGEQ